jgi:hypothetical protein
MQCVIGRVGTRWFTLLCAPENFNLLGFYEFALDKKKSAISKPVSLISRFKRPKRHGTDDRGGNRENAKNPEHGLGMLYNVLF